LTRCSTSRGAWLCADEKRKKLKKTSNTSVKRRVLDVIDKFSHAKAQRRKEELKAYGLPLRLCVSNVFKN
jgi:molecular chaperone GrpE (heat shock protein)